MAEQYSKREDNALPVLHDMLDDMPEGIFVLDSSLRIVFVNRAAERLFRFRKDEAVGSDGHTIVRRIFGLADDVSLSPTGSAKFPRLELSLQQEGEPDLWLEYSSAPISRGPHAGGRIERFTDITAYKRPDSSRNESEAHLRAILKAFDGLLYVCSSDYRIEFINENLIRRTGFDPTGEPCYKALHGLDEICSWCVNDKVLKGETVRWEIKSPLDGHWYSVINTPVHRDGGEVSKLSLISDITESRQAEESLRDLNGALEAIIRSVPAAILFRDGDGNIRYCRNLAVQRIFGWPEREGEGPFAPVPEERREDFESLFRSIVEGGIRSFDRPDRRAGGTPIHVSISGAPIAGSDGEFSGGIAIITDITSQKIIEMALASERSKLDAFVAAVGDGISVHDADYTIIYQNDTHKIMHGSHMGEQCFRAYRGRDTVCEGCFLADCFRDGGVYRREISSQTESGLLHMELTSAPLQDAQGITIAVIEVSRDITDRIRAQNEVEALSSFDTLTGLPNRTLLLDRLTHALTQADRDERMVAVMLLDIDRFKGVNDTLGHDAGDVLLKGVAERLKRSIRKMDTLARIGGDEFVAIFSGISYQEDVSCIAQKVLETVAEPTVIEGHEIFSTGSIGIALYPLDGDNVSDLLKNADVAMYQAKEQGRDNFQFFSQEMNEAAFARLKIESNLRRALERGELSLHYQPQLDLRVGRIVGVEALLRWNSAELGSVSPVSFIPLAEETGLILPIGEWVLRSACTQNKKWQDAGLPPLRMAVNISGLQFRQNGFVEQVQAILDETGLDPAWLELELTESIVMKNALETIGTMRSLQEMGIYLAIDDFGTGYSSLSYLKQFPINRLKIDRSFVNGVPDNQDDAAIVEAVIAMAHSLKFKVIAEGVENVRQQEYLTARRCDEIQGFYYGRPMTAAVLEAFLSLEPSR